MGLFEPDFNTFSIKDCDMFAIVLFDRGQTFVLGINCPTYSSSKLPITARLKSCCNKCQIHPTTTRTASLNNPSSSLPNPKSPDHDLNKPFATKLPAKSTATQRKTARSSACQSRSALRSTNTAFVTPTSMSQRTSASYAYHRCLGLAGRS
jgi:hypothetical protein